MAKFYVSKNERMKSSRDLKGREVDQNTEKERKEGLLKAKAEERDRITRLLDDEIRLERTRLERVMSDEERDDARKEIARLEKKKRILLGTEITETSREISEKDEREDPIDPLSAEVRLIENEIEWREKAVVNTYIKQEVFDKLWVEIIDYKKRREELRKKIEKQKAKK